MALLVLKWRHLVICDQDHSIFKHIIDDLVRFSQIKQKLQSSILSDNLLIG